MTFPTPTPSRSQDQDTFDSAIEAFFVYLPTFENNMEALAAAMNLNSTTDTSASSNSIGTGAKTFTVTAGKSFQPGMWLVIADTAAPTTNAMFAQVTSYSGTTLVVNSYAIMGSGTKTAWVISQSAPAALEGLYALLAGSASQTFSVAPATAAAHAVRSDQLSYNNSTFPLITYSDAYASTNNITHGGTLTVTTRTTKIGRLVHVNITISDTVSLSSTLGTTAFSLEYVPAYNFGGGHGNNMSTKADLGAGIGSASTGNFYPPTFTAGAGVPVSFTLIYIAAS